MITVSARADMTTHNRTEDGMLTAILPADASDTHAAAQIADARATWRRWERDARDRALHAFRTTLLRAGDVPAARADAATTYAAQMRDAARMIHAHYGPDVLPHLPPVDITWTTRLRGPRPGRPTSARTKLRDRWDAVIANPTWARVERHVAHWTRADMLRPSAPPTPRHTCTYAWARVPLMTAGVLAMITVRVRTCGNECPVQALRVYERCLTAAPRRFVRRGLCLSCRLHRRFLAQLQTCRSDAERAALTRRFNRLRAVLARRLPAV